MKKIIISFVCFLTTITTVLGADFSFIAIADYRGSREELKRSLNWAKNNWPSGWPSPILATVSGDMADVDKGYNTIMSVFPGIKVGFGAGNHDVLPDKPNVDNNLKFIWNKKSIFQNSPPFSLANGKGRYPDLVSYSVDVHNSHFVFLDVYKGNDRDANGNYAVTRVDGDLYKWLKADLESTNKQNIFAFAHEPAFPCPGQRHKGDCLNQDPGARDKFWSLLKANKVRAYFVGHTHTYCRKTVDGIEHIDAGAIRNELSSIDTKQNIMIFVQVKSNKVMFRAYADEGRGDSKYIIEERPNRPNYYVSTPSSKYKMMDSWEIITGAADNIKPNAPTNLSKSSVSENSLTISWGSPTPASDGDLAASYRILRDGQFILESTKKTFTDDNLTPNTTYDYKLFSVDDNGNISDKFVTLSVKTTADLKAPEIAFVSTQANNLVRLVFDEEVSQSTAINKNHYQFDQGITIASIALESGGNSVLITLTNTMTKGIQYTVTLTGIEDLFGNGLANTSMQLVYTGEIIIANLSPQDYGLAPKVKAGDKHYVDRDYKITSLPNLLSGATLIRTKNDDKTVSRESHLSFEVNNPVSVLVGYNQGITPPNWLADWNKLTAVVSADHTPHPPENFELFIKSFPAGTVTLGGNAATGAGPEATSNNAYIVFVLNDESPVMVAKVWNADQRPALTLENFPNPFNPYTKIRFHVSKKNARVILWVLNDQGRLIKRLVNERMIPGDYDWDWDGKNSLGEDVPSGVYFIRGKMGTGIYSKKILLIR